MATGDIIQKDLGLVTAYGYALAGGYTGTEEQFKTDFANLMAGKYSGSALEIISRRPYDGGKQLDSEPFAIMNDGPNLFSYLLCYGNISYLVLSMYFSTDFTVSHKQEILIGKVTAGTTISYEDFPKYSPMFARVLMLEAQRPNIDTEIVGFSDQGIYDSSDRDVMKNIRPYYAGRGNSGVVDEEVGVFIGTISDEEDYTIPFGSKVIMTTMFVNSVGQLSLGGN